MLRRLVFLAVFGVGAAAAAVLTEPLFPPRLTDLVEKGQARAAAFRDVGSWTIAAIREDNAAASTSLQTQFIIEAIHPSDKPHCILVSCESMRISTSGHPGIGGKSDYVSCIYQRGCLEPDADLRLIFDVSVHPGPAIIPYTKYYVVFLTRDGHLHQEELVMWTEEELSGNVRGERDVRKQEQAADMMVKRVSVGADYFDIAAQPFIEEYNQTYDHALNEYETKVVKKISGRVSGVLVADIGASLQRSKEPEPFMFPEDKVKEIFERHFVLALVDLAESARLGLKSLELERAARR